MRCPTLNELPPPPPGKACTELGRSAGWPWTEESPQLPETLSGGSSWPRVSIVTPSYNQGQFIEETIRSVLLQGYPNLEYIVMDGGSTDESVNIIRKYEPWLTRWVSQPDRGQSYAINKGWEMSTGDILAWINSDDIYRKNAFSKAVEYLVANPSISVVYSDTWVINEDGEKIKHFHSREFQLSEFVNSGVNWLPQPTTFIRREALDTVGLLNEQLYFNMDYELWLRIGLHFELSYLQDAVFACMRQHPASKGATKLQFPERVEVLKGFLRQLPPSSNLSRAAKQGISRYQSKIARKAARQRRLGEAAQMVVQSVRMYPPSVLSWNSPRRMAWLLAQLVYRNPR